MGKYQFCSTNFTINLVELLFGNLGSRNKTTFLHRKKLASGGAAYQVFFVVTKSAGTAPTASASGKLAARTVTQIKVLVFLNNCISLGVFLYEI
jgi:hypothetical protein